MVCEKRDASPLIWRSIYLPTYHLSIHHLSVYLTSFCLSQPIALSRPFLCVILPENCYSSQGETGKGLLSLLSYSDSARSLISSTLDNSFPPRLQSALSGFPGELKSRALLVWLSWEFQRSGYNLFLHPPHSLPPSLAGLRPPRPPSLLCLGPLLRPPERRPLPRYPGMGGGKRRRGGGRRRGACRVEAKHRGAA